MSQRLYILTASQLIPPYCSWDEIFSVFLCDMQLLSYPYKPKKTLSLVSVLEILTAYALILPWTPFVANGFSCIIEQVKQEKQYEMRDLNVVCCTEFCFHSEVKLFEPQWHYRSHKLYLFKKKPGSIVYWFIWCNYCKVKSLIKI